MKYYAILCLLFVSNLTYAQREREEVVSFEDAYKRSYHVTRLDEEVPQIDGKLDEEIWQTKGEWSEKIFTGHPFRTYSHGLVDTDENILR